MKNPHFAISISLIAIFSAFVVVGMIFHEIDYHSAQNKGVGFCSFLVPIGILGGGITMVFHVAQMYYLRNRQKCIDRTTAFYHEAIEAGLPEYPSPDESIQNMNASNIIAEY